MKMEFDEIIVKDSPGLCRCCLSEGCYKDLGSEYVWMSEIEVYADMLLDCFDISISQHNDGPNGPNRLICEVCITRLRDACNFKKQVLDSEKKFVDMVGKGQFRKTVLTYQDPTKAEASDVPQDGIEVEYLEEEMDFGNDDVTEPLETETPVEEDITVSMLPVKSKRGRPRKSIDKPEKAKVSKVEEKPRTSKVVKGVKCRGTPKATKSSMTTTERNRLMKRNAITILESSSAFPFKWHRHNYLCFFCHQTFKGLEHLKEHSQNDHRITDIKFAVSYLKRDEKVKIDISECTCRLCDKVFDEINSLVNHLKDVHHKVFEDKCGLGVVPYKLLENRFHCAICLKEFQYFIKLNQHMNEHYGNYVCEHCGKSFLSQDRLRCHSLSHGSNFRCSICSEVFESLTLRTKHESHVHNKRRNIKCLFCPETFNNYALRKCHHNSKHNVKVTEISCPICAKPFHILSKMWAHLKEVHVREKNFPCSMCDQKFFSRTHVQKHMVKHLGERIHQCVICKKSYARKQTLRDHMRIHNNDKRFACDVCQQAFIQNNSLRLHMRVHHPESNQIELETSHSHH